MADPLYPRVIVDRSMIGRPGPPGPPGQGAADGVVADYLSDDTSLSYAAADAASAAQIDDPASAHHQALAAQFIAPSVVDAKGDLLVGTAPDTLGRLAAGATGRQLFADATQAAGLRWGAQGELPSAVSSSGNLNLLVTAQVILIGSGNTNNPAGEAGWVTVSRTGAVVLQDLVATPSGRRFTRSSSNTGTAWTPWVEVRAAAPTAGNTITGVVPPEGVVSAAAGTTYINTNPFSALGAIQWVKTGTGVTTTGWQVVRGDTGWRNVSYPLPNGWVVPAGAAYLMLRRSNQTVHLTFLGLEAYDISSEVFLASIVGFRPARVGLVGSAWGEEQISPRPVIHNPATGVYIAAPDGDFWLGTADWLTDDPWPTTLPGQPL